MGLTWKHRQERKRQLLKYIVENTKEEGEELEADKLVALFSWQLSVTPGKVREYLNELHDLGAITGSRTVKATRFASSLLGE